MIGNIFDFYYLCIFFTIHVIKYICIKVTLTIYSHCYNYTFYVIKVYSYYLPKQPSVFLGDGIKELR